MLAAGLLAKKAVERGLERRSGGEDFARARLARGHRLPEQDRAADVSRSARLQHRRLRLHDLHRQLRPAGSGDRRSDHEERSRRRIVLSGNRNFEARVHQNIKANFLMSPPLVVAFALAGRVDIDLSQGAARQRPATARTFTCATSGRRCRKSATRMQAALTPEVFRELYRDFAAQNPKWNEIPSSTGEIYEWDEKSDLHPGAAVLQELRHGAGPHRRTSTARGRSASSATRVTTDHISPAGAIKTTSPAGQYLKSHGDRVRGFQQLRLAPRQRSRDDARHVRQRADQEPDGARRGRRRDHAPAGRRSRCRSTTRR